MPTWPAEFKHLTAEQAWAFANSTGSSSTLLELSHEAQGELAGLSSWGKSGDQVERLSHHVDMFTMGGSTPSYNAEHVQSGLRKLGFADPEENSGIPGYDPWRE